MNQEHQIGLAGKSEAGVKKSCFGESVTLIPWSMTVELYFSSCIDLLFYQWSPGRVVIYWYDLIFWRLQVRELALEGTLQLLLRWKFCFAWAVISGSAVGLTFLYLFSFLLWSFSLTFCSLTSFLFSFFCYLTCLPLDLYPARGRLAFLFSYLEDIF